MTMNINRRSFLAGAGLLATVTALGSSPAQAFATGPANATPQAVVGPWLEAEGIRLFFGDDGLLHVHDGSDAERLRIHKIYITGKISGDFEEPSLVEVDGRPALYIPCTVTSTDATIDLTPYACHVTATVRAGGAFHLDVALTTPDTFANAAGYTQITRSYVPFAAHKTTQAVTAAAWETDPRGGIPFQIPLGTVYSTSVAEGLYVHELAAKNNAEWVGDWNFHLPATAVDHTHYRMEYQGVLGALPAAAAGAQLSTDNLLIGATTEKPFHLWEAESATITFDLTVTTLGAAEDVTVDWALRDFDGTIVGEGRQVMPGLSGIGTVSGSSSSAVPRGSYFLSATATTTTGETATARLTLSVLPQWENPVDAATSKFGIAAVFMSAGAAYGVGRADWVNLMRRIGVRHMRMYQQMEDAERQAAGIQGMFHRGPTRGQLRVGGEWPEGEVDEAARHELLTQYTQDCLDSGVPYFELSNEWNMKGGVLSGFTAEEYARDVLLPMHQYLQDAGASTQLCVMGLAGPDYVWLEKLAEVDDGAAWKATGAVALHTGRGNFTADFAPAPESWGTGSDGTYWNNEGSVLAIQNTIAKLDAQHGTHHELLITETYSVTYENHWWTDGIRNAAENVLLTISLAYRDDVNSFYWYQLNDGVWWHIDGIKPEDKEFSYGLVRVDGSLKPSALAYANAAEHLGDATFVCEYQPGPDAAAGHALVFDTSRGQIQVLWSRADGYVLQADHGDFEDGFYPSTEPWVDEWPTKTAVDLPAAGDVTEIDCLGRITLLPNHGGKVRVILDGAPRIYYGLTLPDDGPDLPPAWSADQTYTAGDLAGYEGKAWKATWWTRGETPGATWGAWQEIAKTPDGTAVWTPTRIFTNGDTAEHDGHLFCAKWWTRNETPGDPNGPWERQ